MELIVYRRIQMFPLRVFGLRLHTPFGKMLFRSITHCWCWEKTQQQLPLGYISWWVQGSLHRGATACHTFNKPLNVIQNTMLHSSMCTCEDVHMCANPALSVCSYKGVVSDEGLITQPLFNHSLEDCFQWFMQHLCRVVLRELRFSFFNGALGSNKSENMST